MLMNDWKLALISLEHCTAHEGSALTVNAKFAKFINFHYCVKVWQVVQRGFCPASSRTDPSNKP